LAVEHTRTDLVEVWLDEEREDVPFVVEFRDGGPGVTVLARRISAPRPARTISIITRSRFERSCRWRGADRRRVAIW
jgi:hypothetical protein